MDQLMIDAPEIRSRRSGNIGRGDRTASLVLGGALAVFGLLRRSAPGLALAAVGAELIHRGVTGHCFAYGLLGLSSAREDTGGRTLLKSVRDVRINRSATIMRTAEELYAFWRDFANLPHFMKHLESVEVINETRSRWQARAPAGMSVAWLAEIVDDVPNALIHWRSLPNVDVQNEGTVEFLPVGEGRGTQVRVSLVYNPPWGIVGSAFARLFGEEPAQQIAEDLRRFKQLMEAREIATIEGQPTGSKGRRTDIEFRQDLQKRFGGRKRDIVEQASWESFPASDSPAW